ncbi:phosphomannomutase/phosphoglucomutase [Candidatus Woesearchaeota archaeon]|nr:phosphomannomutase/phosphoglucomutase [Candidatus Woesearchaeota archaeon]
MQKEVTCFKAYDIRGTYPDEFNEALAYRIGRAFVLWAKCRNIYIGRDCRVSSPKLAHALMNGLRDQGCHVIDLGLVSTPMLYLASRKGDALMVTASHNPAKYNGIKVMRKGVRPIGYSNGLNAIESIVLRNKFPAAKRGKLIRKSILRSYLAHVMTFAKNIKQRHAVLDAGNGMAGLTIPRILEHLPLQATLLHFKLDGSFPNHVPNPAIPENVKDCAQMTALKKADLGASFDGDMDRAMFVDETGRIVPADLLLALFATHDLREHPGRAVVYDCRASRALRNAILANGGVPIECRVGHSFIKNRMSKEGAILGGELSGHYYFKQNFSVESADIAFIKVLNIMSKTGLKLSELIAPFRQYENSGELSFEIADKTKTLKAIAKAFKDGKQRKVDGLTVEYDDAWFNVRASQTEPVMRLVVESSTKERLMELKKHLLKFLR